MTKLADREKRNLSDSEDITEDDILLKLHEEAIRTLSPQQQKVYKLHYINGVKNKEIAEILGISLYTVKEYLKIASKSVREYVGKRIDLMVLLALEIFFN